MNYKLQLAVVEGLSLQSDIQTRMDCPFCNGRNTFSVDTTEGNLNWYCFHASCSAKGKKQGEKNMQYVERVFHGNQELHLEDVNFNFHYLKFAKKIVYDNEFNYIHFIEFNKFFIN